MKAKTPAKRAPRKRKEADYVLILRTCNEDMTSHNGFQWPTSGIVKAPDWKPTKACGNGLHGLLWGAGDGSLLDWDINAKWVVGKVRADSIIDLGGKVKFPEAEVLYAGDRKTATDLVAADPRARYPIVGATVTGGHGATVTGGDGATVTGGDRATVTGGYRATVTGGEWATVTGGYRATVTGGEWAELRARWYDKTCSRYRTAVAYVGENGIRPGVKYRLNDKQEFVEAQP